MKASPSIDDVLDRVVEWAAGRPDIRAVALVGSCARDAMRTDSDVDLIVLTSRPQHYSTRDDWIGDVDLGELIQTKEWGAITERRLRLPDGLEIEIGFGEPTWASIDPVDPGTRQVVADGMRSLYDPDELLQQLQNGISTEF